MVLSKLSCTEEFTSNDFGFCFVVVNEISLSYRIEASQVSTCAAEMLFEEAVQLPCGMACAILKQWMTQNHRSVIILDDVRSFGLH